MEPNIANNVYDANNAIAPANNIKRYYQRSTTNRSFVEMSNYLKSIGVKNNRFMLTLLDPDLANIDPHDPNLPEIYKYKVFYEVINNFWYYFHKFNKIKRG